VIHLVQTARRPPILRLRWAPQPRSPSVVPWDRNNSRHPLAQVTRHCCSVRRFQGLARSRTSFFFPQELTPLRPPPPTRSARSRLPSRCLLRSPGPRAAACSPCRARPRSQSTGAVSQPINIWRSSAATSTCKQILRRCSIAWRPPARPALLFRRPSSRRFRPLGLTPSGQRPSSIFGPPP
jgi:hypothetical protein